MLVTIIIIAVISFLLVLFFFNYQDVRSYLKKIFEKKKKVNKVKEEPKPSKYEPTYEEFKPVIKEPEVDRDSSVEELFNMNDFDDDYLFEDDFNESDNIFTREVPSKSKTPLENFNEDAFDEIFRKYGGEKKKKKSLAKQIRDLPPEIKVMVVDNVLNKKDDI